MKRVIQALCGLLTALLVVWAFASCGIGTEPAETAVPETIQIDDAGATVITWDGTGARVSGEGAAANGTDVRIQSGGTYAVRGTVADGRIVVDAQDADVTLVLDNAQIASRKPGAICILRANRTTLYAKEGTRNALTDGGETTDGADASAPNACVYARSDLILAGSGAITVNGLLKNGVACHGALRIADLTLTVNAAGNGVSGKGGVAVQNADLTVLAGGGSAQTGGDNAAKGLIAGADISIDGGRCTFDCAGDTVHADANVMIRSGTLTATTADDAIHAQNRVTIDGGEIDLTAHEGIEGTRIAINGGKIRIRASDDGINAAHKTSGVTPSVEINGGDLRIEMEPGDTDGVDANGDIRINGGTIRITAQSPFDFDGKGELNGGTVYVNGKQVTKLENTGGRF